MPEDRPRISITDWLMLVLAVVSIGLLAWETWGQVDAPMRELILQIDLAICGIFAAEFALRASRTEDRIGFVTRNWYEVVGMIPAAHPAIRGFRLFRVIRILILLGRFGNTVNRVYGAGTFNRWLQRGRMHIVRFFSGAITVSVLDEVAAVLVKGQYTRNIARALEENRRPLKEMLGEKLRNDPELKRFARLPFYGAMVDTAVAASLRIAHEALTDPRTDELIADALRENLNQLRDAVRTADAHRHHEASLPDRPLDEPDNAAPSSAPAEPPSSQR